MATTPAAPSGSFDFARAFTFVPEDPEWIKKLLIGGAFALASMFLIGIPFVAGYWMRLVQRAARGEARPLPDWDDLGGFFASGLKLVGAYLAYGLAVGLPFIVAFFGVALVGGGISQMTRRSREASEAMAGLTGLALFALYGVLILVSLALAVYLPAALARLSLQDRFGAAFEIGENLAFIRRNTWNYVLALVIYLIGSFAAQFGILLFCIGIFPVSFWALCMFGFALGEVARLDPAR